MTHRLLPLVACALFALALAGCAEPAPKNAAAPTSQSLAPRHTSPGATRPVGGLAEMPAAQKLAELNSSFVTEWPVAAGKVLGASARSGNRLDYALEVAAPAATVEQWYRTVMEERAFVLTAESASPDGGATLTYFRAGMGYVVRIDPTGDRSSRVQGTLTTSASTAP